MIQNDEITILGTIVITPLLNARAKLQEAIETAQNQLERDGAIQRFEFTYELIWKTLKKVLATKGVDVNSPRDVFREAAKQGLTTEPLVWFEFIKMRNLTTHIYKKEFADEIFAKLPDFERELDLCIKKLLMLK